MVLNFLLPLIEVRFSGDGTVVFLLALLKEHPTVENLLPNSGSLGYFVHDSAWCLGPKALLVVLETRISSSMERVVGDELMSPLSNHLSIGVCLHSSVSVVLQVVDVLLAK